MRATHDHVDTIERGNSGTKRSRWALGVSRDGYIVGPDGYLDRTALDAPTRIRADW